MNSKKLFFTSESVTEGHPDKMCDQISDAVLDACLEQDPMSRVACETAVKTGYVMCFGEITTHAFVNFDQLVRQVVNSIGFDSSEKGFDGNTCGVLLGIASQSPDIAQGVDAAMEVRGNKADDIEKVGAGDQGMMFGFACNETPEYMPMPIAMAHRLALKLSAARKNGDLYWLRPDGKTQVTVEYSAGKPVRIGTVLISTQHAPEISQEEINQELTDKVIMPTLPQELVDASLKIYTNPTGRFVVGGPMGDAGLTGRKIIVDTYGGMGRHGGGAFSGKDPTKVDRSAAYMARHVSKCVVAAGLADKCQVALAYAIGVAQPVSINVETFGTEKVDPASIGEKVLKNFDMSPKGIIDHLGLRDTKYRLTAKNGHFGNPAFPWERTTESERLK